MLHGDVAHCTDGGCAQAAALEVARHHDHERTEGVRTAFVEAARDRTVDPRGQIVDRAVPAKRDGSGTRKDLAVVVEEVELELGALVGQPAPVDVENVAVVVVLGQRVARSLPRWADEVGPLGDCRCLHLSTKKKSHRVGGAFVHLTDRPIKTCVRHDRLVGLRPTRAPRPAGSAMYDDAHHARKRLGAAKPARCA